LGGFNSIADIVANATNLNSYTSYSFNTIFVTNLGLNKISVSPVKIPKNSIMHVTDYNGIIPIDTSGNSKYSDYLNYYAPYTKLSYNSSNWRFYFRTETNRIQRINLNKTYDKSGEFSIWAVVNGKKINNLQRIEVLPSINYQFLLNIF
jgi:hypothetical protein